MSNTTSAKVSNQKNVYNGQAVYKTAAPKFVAANSIKMHQAKTNSYNSKNSGLNTNNSASVKNLHEFSVQSGFNGPGFGGIGPGGKRYLMAHTNQG